MTGLTSDISIASNALLLIGHDTIASFTEGSAGATIASNLYETTYLSLLTNYRWRFAAKKEKLARLTKTPIDRFSYAFQIPSDCIYVITPDTKYYEIYGSLLLCNNEEVILDYTYRVAEDKLPPYFTNTLEYLLASKFSVPVTGDLNKADMYFKQHLDQLKKARFTDSTQRPADTFLDSPYITIRY